MGRIRILRLQQLAASTRQRPAPVPQELDRKWEHPEEESWAPEPRAQPQAPGARQCSLEACTAGCRAAGDHLSRNACGHSRLSRPEPAMLLPPDPGHTLASTRAEERHSVQFSHQQSTRGHTPSPVKFCDCLVQFFLYATSFLWKFFIYLDRNYLWMSECLVLFYKPSLYTEMSVRSTQLAHV